MSCISFQSQANANSLPRGVGLTPIPSDCDTFGGEAGECRTYRAVLAARLGASYCACRGQIVGHGFRDILVLVAGQLLPAFLQRLCLLLGYATQGIYGATQAEPRQVRTENGHAVYNREARRSA